MAFREISSEGVNLIEVAFLGRFFCEHVSVLGFYVMCLHCLHTLLASQAELVCGVIARY
jgi:hypothetical protein